MADTNRIAVLLIALTAATLPIGGAVARQSTPSAPSQDEQPEMDAILEQAMAELMKPGPRRADWDKGGADLHAMVAAAPGGAKRNYILSTDKEGDRTVTIVGAADLAGAIPKDWQVTSRVGSAPAGDIATDVTIGQLVPPFYFAGFQGRRRIGDSFCSSGPMTGVLYKESGGTAAELPVPMVQLMFEHMFRRLEDMAVCWRYDRHGDAYSVSYFLEDGQSLPALDSMAERIRIVPAGDIQKMLETVPKSAQ